MRPGNSEFCPGFSVSRGAPFLRLRKRGVAWISWFSVLPRACRALEGVVREERGCSFFRELEYGFTSVKTATRRSLEK